MHHAHLKMRKTTKQRKIEQDKEEGVGETRDEEQHWTGVGVGLLVTIKSAGSWGWWPRAHGRTDMRAQEVVDKGPAAWGSRAKRAWGRMKTRSARRMKGNPWRTAKPLPAQGAGSAGSQGCAGQWEAKEGRNGTGANLTSLSRALWVPPCFPGQSPAAQRGVDQRLRSKRPRPEQGGRRGDCRAHGKVPASPPQLLMAMREEARPTKVQKGSHAETAVP